MRFPLKPKKGDIFAVLFVILICVLSFLPFLSKNAGSSVRITLDGEELAVLSLFEDREYEVHGDYDATVVIKNGKVSVKNSTCPNKDCENCGEIEKAGSCIVCLPNRLSVEIGGSDTDIVIG